MRKTLTAVLFAAALPTLAFAMPDAGPGEHHGKRGQHMFQALDLSRDQQSEIRKLMGEQMKSRHDITQRYLDKLPDAERKAMQDELASSQEKTRQQINALLKPEQQKQFEELQKKMEDKRAEREEFLKWKAEQNKQS
ncbi:Spy/CpxP family protein refolding chaperone [Pseudomonas oligotrophica]|uniref:Spy/CpxP family protein refolding chaperone n=1 Tax=Pseudomonas oligotrophica TaxID=2912055 RepID=UPI001F1F76DE|nr:P pilus assembly/Cpx signaling pathway, periplasmic inhibitor/zinc-resistance associated protein [Pseudomonas oligotrophica]MCF7204036.1 P pilus assembly/Cpx signaling pathway, periplasmic inhibitor/zinc-resistance associated protein [Pseudomonas oligotrophica]